MDADQKELEVRINRIEAASKLEADMKQTGAPPAGQPTGTPEENAQAAEHERIFRSYLRVGGKAEGLVGSMSDADRRILNQRYRSSLAIDSREQHALGLEKRDMAEAGLGTGIATGAGVLVPVGFVQQLEVALKYYGPMLDGAAGLPTIFPTPTGQNLPWPTENDTTAVGEQVGEGQQVTFAEVTLSQIIFGAYKYSSKFVKVSIELLQDAAIPVDPILLKAFAIRLGRILNQKFTTGTGTSEPKGIVTAAAFGGTAVGTSPNDGGSVAPNSLGSDDLTTLEHSVDPWYRVGARFMFHDSTLAALKKVKDKYGRPLWMTSIRENEPDMINGYRYAINNDMDQLQTQATSPTVDKKVILFGQLDKYMVRRVREMSILRLEERFAEFGQVGFLAFCRYDGNLLDAGTNPVKYMKATF